MQSFLFQRNAMSQVDGMIAALTDAQIDLVAGADPGTGCIGTHGICCTSSGCKSCTKSDCDTLGGDHDTIG